MLMSSMDLSSNGPLQYLFLGVVAFFSAILGGISSFGASLIMTPAMAPVIGIKAVVPVMAVAMTFGNLSRMWVYRKDIQTRTLLQIMIPALPSLLLGTYLYKILSQHMLELIIGLFLLVILPLRRYMAHKQIVPTPAMIIMMSVLFGFISGALPGGGVVLLPILLGIGLVGGGVIGTDACIGMATNVFKVVFFLLFSLLSTRYLLYGLLIGFCMIPGTYLARWLLGHLHVKIHTYIIEALIFFSGLSFLYSFIIEQA